MKTPTKRATRRLAASLAIATAIFATSSAWAANVYWTGAVNNYWDETGNWSGQDASRPLPTNDDAFFTNTGTYKDNEVVFTNACANAYRSLIRGVGTAGNPLVFRATAAANGFAFGDYNNYRYPTQIGGAIGETWLRLVNGTWSARFLFIGNGSSNPGHLELKDINSFTIPSALEVLNGTCVLDGGSITIQGGDWSRIGNGSGTVADFTINKGSVTITGSGNSSSLYIGNGSGNSRDAAKMTIKEGGSFTATGNANALCVGRGSPGTLNIEGGIATLYNLNFCSENGGAGSVANITEGGVLYTDQIKVANDSRAATLNIDGGKIKPRNNNNLFGAAYTEFHVYVGANGAEFDASGLMGSRANYNIAEDIEDKAGEKGVVKFSGGKTVTLSGTGSQWTGGTIIALGTTNIATTAAAKAAVIDNGLVVDGTGLTEAGDYTVFQYSGGTLTQADLDKVSFRKCGSGTTKAISGSGDSVVVHFEPFSWKLDGDRTWSELVTAYGAPDTDDVLKISVTDSDATLTVDGNAEVAQIVFADGTGATLKIDAGYTLMTEGISGCVTNVLNDGTFVKMGAGEATLPFNKGYAAAGVTIVSNGTLKASVVGHGDNCLDVIVASGATFDINGSSVSFDVTLEAGAHFVNDGSDINNTWQQVNKITLSGDADVTANGKFGFLAPSSGTTYLNLGSHTLEVSAASNKEFMLNNTTISGDGTISVTSGRFCTRSHSSKGANCTLSIGANGLFENNVHFTVKNFVNNGTISYASGWGRGELEVTGRFESKATSFPKLTLTDATVKPTADGVVTVLDTFKASGTITIDASEITAAQLKAAETGIAVLTVPATFDPSGATWSVTGAAVSCTRAKWRTDEGGTTKTLYVAKPTGLMLIFR